MSIEAWLQVHKRWQLVIRRTNLHLVIVLRHLITYTGHWFYVCGNFRHFYFGPDLETVGPAVFSPIQLHTGDIGLRPTPPRDHDPTSTARANH